MTTSNFGGAQPPPYQKVGGLKPPPCPPGSLPLIVMVGWVARALWRPLPTYETPVMADSPFERQPICVCSVLSLCYSIVGVCSCPCRASRTKYEYGFCTLVCILWNCLLVCGISVYLFFIYLFAFVPMNLLYVHSRGNVAAPDSRRQNCL